MKTPEEVKLYREIVARPKELGMTEEDLKPINDWIDEQERLYDEFLKTTNPIKRMGKKS